MKNPRKLLWFLLPAAIGIVSVSIGFSAYRLNFIENNDGKVTESLYSVTFHLNLPKTTDASSSESSSESSSPFNSDITFDGLEYTSGLDLIVLPNELNEGKTFNGWNIGPSREEAAGTKKAITNSDKHYVNDLLDKYYEYYSTAPSDNAIHLWDVWTAATA